MPLVNAKMMSVLIRQQVMFALITPRYQAQKMGEIVMLVHKVKVAIALNVNSNVVHKKKSTPK